MEQGNDFTAPAQHAPSGPGGAQAGFSPMRDLEAYMEREADFDDGIGPDGCYYCGGEHPSDSCMSQDRADFYRELEAR